MQAHKSASDSSHFQMFHRKFVCCAISENMKVLPICMKRASSRGWKREKKERPKNDVCIAITMFALQSQCPISLLSVFNSVQL